ncbi:DUF4240 domain-containing protein [Acetivibrio clariflavus]|uniref:DUF4240 domain-containing protein n=1 Tax=Acetivibrio clariflavus TaxID=288965 RepID=UPI00048576DC|nr:DUF4240 domain-containing protein [Acetivibrio clariflavus]
MNNEMFWEMISNSRKNNKNDSSRFLEILTSEISKLPEEDIFEFEKILIHNLVRSYTSELWAAAYIINGGCSDDGFNYFQAWLISQGKVIYENAIKDPQSLANVISEDQAGEVEFEEFLGVCADAYKMKTGKDDFYENFERIKSSEIENYPEIELNWSEDESSLEKMFPKLVQKFW